MHSDILLYLVMAAPAVAAILTAIFARDIEHPFSRKNSAALTVTGLSFLVTVTGMMYQSHVCHSGVPIVFPMFVWLAIYALTLWPAFGMAESWRASKARESREG
jgi:hypothetical protein